MHFDSAGSHKVCAAGFSALGVRHFDGKFSHERALVEILLDSCLRVPVQVLFTEDLVDILVRSFLRGPCLKALVEALGRFLYPGLVRSAPAAAGGPLRSYGTGAHEIFIEELPTGIPEKL